MMAAKTDSASVEYEGFAPFYDSFTAASDYEAWTEHVLDLARRLGLSGDRQLDLACGTGKSFLPFLERVELVEQRRGAPRRRRRWARCAPSSAVRWRSRPSIS